MSRLIIASTQELEQLTSKRAGETKIGETVQTLDNNQWEQSLQNSTADFVLLGIPEDVGIKANYGVGGAHTTWSAALKAILNVQHTDLLPGDKIAVLGRFDFSDLMQFARSATVDELRSEMSVIDNTVSRVVQAITEAGKIPVIIGGGHNNAYPILKGVSKGRKTAVNCINLDAHSDYRVMEGRHSGNGFRYAKQEGFLEKYAMVALHRNYNSQNVLNDIAADKNISCSFYEDIFLDGRFTFREAIEKAIQFTQGLPTGIELDLDCIEGVLSSAATPCGITTLQARQYLATAASQSTPCYLHIAEGAVKLNDDREDPSTAKLIAYLVTDFVRQYS